jgi:hypothetical protein
LPPDIAQFGQEAGNRLVKFQHWTSEARQTLLRIFNYSSLIIGALNSGFGSRIVITDQCEELDDAGVSGRFALWLPRVVRQFLGSIGVSAAYCDPRLWSHAYRRDGSHNGRYVKRNPVLNQNSLNQESIALGPEDSDELKAVLREISQIVSEKGRTIVFIIPPVYETPRYGISDRVLSEAFAALPELNLVDHRNLGQREDFFIRYDHPSEEYFRYLVAELIRLNFMDADHLSGSSQ